MRVMIVEDQTMIRSLLESYFHAEDGYQITASIPGAKQAVEVCRTSSVDQRGHNNNFALRLYGFDLTNGSQSVLAVLRLHIHQNQIDGACPAHLNLSLIHI